MGKMPKSQLEVLEDARDILDKPEHWTQGTLARDLDGTSVYLSNSSAVCFCLVGALTKANDGMDISSVYKLSRRAFPDDGRLISEINDSSTHAEVLVFLDTLIEFETVDSIDMPWED